MGGVSRSKSAEQMESLRRQIRHHNYLYYIKNQPEISDEKYDRLFNNLKRLEQKFPDLITPDSPTQRVGAHKLGEFPSAEHVKPLLSLEATLAQAEVRHFDEHVRKTVGEVDYILEEKFDGLSVELVYEDGLLKRASTRGDGRTGEEITANARTIPYIPLRLRTEERDPPHFLAVRGEVIMNTSDFERLNRSLIEQGGASFANPRNAAAGSLRQLDPRVTARRPLNFVAYEVLALDGAQFQTDSEVLDALADWGFRVPAKILTTGKSAEIVKQHDQWEEERDHLDYEIDGMVIKVSQLDARERLGATSHHPRWALAYKFEPRRGQTRVVDIAVQVGRSGVLTPVALMRPVEVSGVTVSRATLHNREELARKDIRVGDLVRVERAGDVIPEVVGRVDERGRKRHARFQMPAKCPSCGTAVVEKGRFTLCPNHYGCPAQLKGIIVHFASKEALDIENLGAETVSALVEHRLVRSLPDLFRLKPKDLLQLEGFAEKSADRLVNAIQSSKRGLELARFIHALGIPEVGSAVARDLADHFRNFESLQKASREQLEQVPGIGPKMSHSIHGFLADGGNRKLIEALRKEVSIKRTTEEGSKPLRGRKFVFTGSLEQFSRSEAKDAVESLGARASSSVSSETDFVVAGSDPGQKLANARRSKAKILNEDQFVKLIRQAGHP